MKDIEKMNKKQVDKAIDRAMDEKENLIWKLIDIQFRIGDLFEREVQLKG